MFTNRRISPRAESHGGPYRDVGGGFAIDRAGCNADGGAGFADGGDRRRVLRGRGFVVVGLAGFAVVVVTLVVGATVFEGDGLFGGSPAPTT
jgi:hypothetical protein